ncbi:MAG: alanyl-tRNA editing protein [Ignavibacteriaceae bacterium]
MEEKKKRDPKMHSAEHILNQTMVRMFNRGRSFSAHIEKKKSKCDYHFDRNLTELEANEIEKRVNEVIESNIVVKEEFLEREEASKYFQLEKLPEEVGDKIRIIKIGDYDACPCSGIHVKSTKEIGKFKFLSSSFENGVLRLRFKLDN